MKSTAYLFLLFVTAFLYDFAFAQLLQISTLVNTFVNDQGQSMVFKDVNTGEPAKFQRSGPWEKAYFEEALNGHRRISGILSTW